MIIWPEVLLLYNISIQLADSRPSVVKNALFSPCCYGCDSFLHPRRGLELSANPSLLSICVVSAGCIGSIANKILVELSAWIDPGRLKTPGRNHVSTLGPSGVESKWPTSSDEDYIGSCGTLHLGLRMLFYLQTMFL